MPLTPKGMKIKRAMVDQYGSEKKGASVFFASANAGRITGVHKGKKLRQAMVR
jgi:hypothetical protein